jgi:hypothetical protein
MNLWTYLDGNPAWAVLLVLVTGWTLARLFRAWRDRRPVAVRLVLVCPTCGDEHDHGENHGGIVEVRNA